jgi:hypothetical protein
MAVKGPGRTALSDLRRHCSEQHSYVAIVDGDLRDQSAGSSRNLVSQQYLEEGGIKLYDDCFELGSTDREVRLVRAAREYADAPSASHAILIAAGGTDAKAELPFGDETHMRPMPSPQNVLPVAGIVFFQQKAKPRGYGARK